MTPDYKNIWHQHKDWPHGMWVRYTDDGNFQVENAYYNYTAYLKIWLYGTDKTNGHLFDIYVPEDWTLRSNDCQYVWLKKDFGAVDIEWSVCGIFEKEPPKIYRFVKVFLNLKTNEWSIT